MAFLRRRKRRTPGAPRRAAPQVDPRAFTKINAIQDSIRELYAKLTGARVKSYSANLAPQFSVIQPGQDPTIGAQHLAKTMARHLMMTDVQLIVSFKELGQDGSRGHAGEVELGQGPDYFITLSPRYRNDLRDTAAVLAHEVLHVFLHRSGIRFADQERNEILTDTASVYLGTGWLMLNAHRLDITYSANTRTTSTHALGYVSVEEFGYILAKRALAFGEDIGAYLAGNNVASRAYQVGYRRALADYERAPLADCGTTARLRYRKDKKYAEELTRTIGLSGLAAPSEDGYRFEGHDPMKVVFRCPACHHLTRVPVDRTATIRCGVCRSTMKCET